VFAPSDDIEEYLNRVVDEYSLRDYMLFNTAVQSAAWSDATSSYTVTTSSDTPMSTLTAQFLVSSTGQLSIPKLPTYAEAYLVKAAKSSSPNKPTILHSALYDRTIPLAGKTVAIIGNGSTGVQLVESLQPRCGKLVLFQRSPKWLMPKPFYTFPKLLLYPLQLLPFKIGNRLIRYWCYSVIETLHVAVSKPGILQRLVQKILRIKLLQANPNAEEMNCIPSYRPGCSRIIVHAGYPEILTRDNVRVVNDALTGMSDTGGLLTKSKAGAVEEIKADVIIYATGFSITNCGPQFTITNGSGEKLDDVWKSSEGGNTLYGITTPRFPNLFIMYGPHTNTILGSITFFSECAANYVSQMIKNVVKRGLKSVTVKPAAVKSYNDYVEKSFVGRPEMDDCSAWYKAGGGKVPVTNFPGGMSMYWWMTRRPKSADYDMK
jgi:cation diffusion facilitator CzcD-associated flavoprotein CzcO